MPKRKRNDFLNKIPSDYVEIEVGGGGSFEEKFLEESDRKKPPPAVDEVSKEVLVPIDNELDTKDHSPPSSSSTVKSYFNLRRKSNRILRKSNHVSQNIISSSNEDSTVTVVEIDSTVNGENVKKEVSTSDVSSTSTVASSSATTNKPVSAGKSLRKFQAWTEDDIRWFFEALCEHGKDFPHIQSYIASRCEKKGMPTDLIKNYEQVRHYYYRLCHKILQMLKISDVVDKGVQELYGLINYGEIWKRFGAKVDSKLGVYLQQLVDYGHTVFKVKGKTVRVKTPICNALKRIHNLKYKNSGTITKPILPPLPKEIGVILIPATMADWFHVHCLSQNPRLCTKLTMQQRLSTLIGYLENRWSEARISDNTSRALFDVGLFDQDCTTASGTTRRFMIRLKARATEKLQDKVTFKSTTNSISCNSYRSTTHGLIDLSLSAYLKKILDNSLNGNKKSKIKKSLNKKSNQADQSTANDEKEIESKEEKEQTLENQPQEEKNQPESQPIDLLKLLDSMNEELEVAENILSENRSSKFEEVKNVEEVKEEVVIKEVGETLVDSCPESNEERNNQPEPPANATLAQWLSGEYANNLPGDNAQEEDGEDKPNVDKPTEEEEKTQPDNTKSGKKRRGSSDTPESVNLLTAEQARLGWTLANANTVTIGEVYLLFSCPSRIVLEYSCIEVEEENVKQIQSESHPMENVQNDEVTSCDHESANQLGESKEPGEPKPLRIMEKFLVAASMTLNNYKKQNIPGTQSSAALACSQKSRKRKSLTQQSQLLPNLIQETILDDKDATCSKSAKGKTKTTTEGKGEEVKTTTTPQFATPKLPAPKNKNRTTAVLNDSVKVEEALKELKSNLHRRHRRPLHKPLMYNLQNKMLASNLANGKHSAVLVISASHLNSADGSSSKQILLSDLLSTHMPQISIASNTPVSSSLSTSQKELPPASVGSKVVIPIKVEAKPIVESKSTYSTAATVKNSIEQVITSSDEATSTFNYESFNSHQPNEKVSNFGSPTLAPSTSAFTEIVNNDADDDDKSIREEPLVNNIGPLSNSQLSWLNEINSDISIGSLFGEDNQELTLNHKLAIDTSLELTSDIDTHVSSLANDNSVDLMAKFADLAATITSDSKHY